MELWRDPGTTQGLFGEVTEEWSLIGSRWASVQPGRGSERFAQESERTSQAVTIVVRHDELTATLTRKDRIRYNSFEYDIESVSDRFSEHRYIEVLAVHRSPEANRLPAP